MRTFWMLSAIVLSGCGACGDLAGSAVEKGVELGVEKATGVAIDKEQGALTIKSDQGTVQVGGAGQKVPDDLPVPAPGDAKVTMTIAATGADAGRHVTFLTAKEPKALADEWEPHLKGKGFTVERVNAEMNTTTMVTLSFKGPELEGGVQLTSDSGAETKETAVMAQWRPVKKEPEGEAAQGE